MFKYVRSLFFSLLWKHFVRQQPLVSQSYNGRFPKEILYRNNSNNSIFEATVNTITENWGTSGKIVISSIHDYSKIYILFSVALTTGNQLCPHGLSTIGDERLRQQWKMYMYMYIKTSMVQELMINNFISLYIRTIVVVWFIIQADIKVNRC